MSFAMSQTLSPTMWVRLALAAVFQPSLLGLLLFYPPGRFAWWHAWVLMAVFFVATIASLVVLVRTNPTILVERFKPPLQRGQPFVDKVVVVVFIPAFLGALRFVPYDVFVLRLLPPPGTFVAAAGMVWLLAGWWIVTAALEANAFAVPVVKSQADRRQVVVDRGPYAFVRHPMYLGTALLLVGMPLWLGSSAGALAALVPIAVLAVRIGIEEGFLRRELAGYAAYTERVRYRLVPGVW
jgi:protein-S-isoprenylcysteine O-methyltransferase Ste14